MKTSVGSKNTAWHCSLNIMCFSWTSRQVKELLNWVVNSKNAGLRFSVKTQITCLCSLLGEPQQVLLCDAGLEIASPGSSLVPQKAALKDSKERWCQDGTRVVPRKGRTHREHQHSAQRQTSSTGACALPCTMLPLMASFFHILKGHEKPNNSKDLSVIFDPRISEQNLILSILQMGK